MRNAKCRPACIYIAVAVCSTLASLANDRGFLEDTNCFVPFPSNAVLKLATSEIFIWRTEGKSGPEVRPSIPFRYYMQYALGEPARFIYEGVAWGADNAKVLGASKQGSLLWDSSGYVYRAADSVPKGHIERLQADALGGWSVQFSFDDVETTSRAIWWPIFKDSVEGRLSKEVRDAGFDVALTLTVELTLSGGRGKRFATTTIYFCPLTAYPSYTFPRWKNVALDRRSLKPPDIKMLWPVVAMSESSFTIWNGKVWTNIQWQVEGTKDGLK